MSPQNKVAIIILVWNDYENTKKCLQSCSMLSYDNLQVIVVDNASSDGCCRRLVAEFPWAEFVFNETNLGYAAGNNIGIKRALELGAEYVFVINNDVVIESMNIIEEMAICFKLIPSLGVLSPRILQMSDSDTNIVYNYGCFLYNFIDKYFLATDSNRLVLPSDSKISKQIVVPGCAIMLSKDLISKIGYFNEEFFMFEEEDDLCLRAAKGCLIVANISNDRVVVWHKAKSSYSGLPPWKAFLLARNRFLQVRSFSLFAQMCIVFIHFLSICRFMFLNLKTIGYRAHFGYLLGFIAGLILWFKDTIGISTRGEYLIQARNVVEGKMYYGKLLNINFHK
ncbi:MAG: glycosyltransferase [Planctomycetota bacterium]|jgi:GT2 family glycosyltransferase